MDHLDEKLNSDRTEQVVTFPKKMQGMGEIERPHLGMKLFGVDSKTGIAEEVKFKASSLTQKRVPQNKMVLVRQLDLVKTEDHHQVVLDPNKWYVWSINKSNAERKYRQMRKKQRENG
jgi:hypothetical protein